MDLEKRVSTLKIHFANRHDAGSVVCSVGNGVREIVRTRTTRLIVSHEPTIVKAAELSKYAVERGSPAYLTCRAVYVPGEAEFEWFMQSDVLSKKASKRSLIPSSKFVNFLCRQAKNRFIARLVFRFRM